MQHSLRALFTAAVAAFILIIPSIAPAHPGHDDDHVAQDLPLLAAVVSLGGGASAFKAGAFRRALAPQDTTEDRALRAALGTATVDRFDEVFTYVVRDGLAALRRSSVTLPAPLSTDPNVVAAALYRAGQHVGAFDVEQLFDVLFSPGVHAHAMIAVGRAYGADGESAYHAVLARLIQDLGTAPARS